MSSANGSALGRYRRRILGWGALAFVATFVIGSIIMVPTVQSDLEDRVGDELHTAGFAGVSVSFSGQDGTISCDSPLADPNSARRVAQDVWGVRTVDLDGACVTTEETPPGDGDADADGGTSVAPATVAPATVAPATVAPATVAPATAPPVTEPPVDTTPATESIADLIAQDPQFGQLAELVATAELGELLAGDAQLTLLAPTDDAFDATFDALGADDFRLLTSDPFLLREVLLHHATDGALLSSDFVAGPLLMLDDTTIEVDPDHPDGIRFVSGDIVAMVDDPETQLDIIASNGVIHAIDQVLLPTDLVIGVPASTPTTSVTLENGQFTFAGAVQSEAQRQQLLGAVATIVDIGNVIDQLEIEPAVAVTAADVDRAAQLVSAMVPNLVSATLTITGDVVGLTGISLGEPSQARVEVIGETLGAEVALDARPVADAVSALELQDELNEFVRSNPILFEPNVAILQPETAPLIQQLAARVQRLAGVSITIVGHTDTAGTPEINQVLSEARAAAVVSGLLDRFVPAEVLFSEGRGQTEPILDANGLEDAAASRRVEFVVDFQ